MQSPKQNAVYNARIPCMSRRFLRCLRSAASLLLLMWLFHPPLLRADNWAAAEEQLAGKIVAVTGPGTMALEVVNHSAINSTDAEAIRRGLLTQLAALGVHFVSAEQAAAAVRVSLSENLQNYVWIAEIHQGASEASTVMVSLPLPEMHAVEQEALAISLRKTLLWSQKQRILDVAVLDGSPAHMVVLDANGAELYRLQDNRWQLEQSLPIAHARPWPRDLRGRLVLRKDHLFDAYLPGVFCQSASTSPLTINCRDSDDPWPLGTDQQGLNAFFTPAQNFFTGALRPAVGKQTAALAFYSAAAVPREKYTLWLFSTLDGQLHMLDGITDQTAGKLGWGSDIAAVKSGCGSGWQVLASKSGEGAGDSLRAFEIADREPVAVSQPVEFGGNITALWSGSDGGSAIAVSRNIESGNYEAFRLNVICGR